MNIKGDGNSSGPTVYRSWILRQAEELTKVRDRFGA